MDVTVHYNPHLGHHFGWVNALCEGIGGYGNKVIPTTSRAPVHGTVNVVIGPHYCLGDHMKIPNTLFLDRCFFNNPTIHASLGWLRPDGSRNFKNDNCPADRWQKTGLEISLWGKGDAAIIFGDYTTEPRRYLSTVRATMEKYEKVFFRPHPQQPGWMPPCPVLKGDLDDAFKMAKVAIGWCSSVLVQAAIKGVPVVCLDRRNVVAPVAASSLDDIVLAARKSWAYNLAYSQWHVDEIANGEAWGHLWD